MKIRLTAVALVALTTLFAFSGAAHAGDAFFKFGILMNEIDESFDFADRWKLGAGSDWLVGDMVGIGFEVQFAYRQYDVVLGTPGVEGKFRAIPLNILANVKFKPAMDGSFHPYFGGGGGLMGSFNSFDTEVTTIEVNNEFDGGVHLVGGMELGPDDGAAFLVEFEVARRLTDGAVNEYFLSGGVRF